MVNHSHLIWEKKQDKNQSDRAFGRKTPKQHVTGKKMDEIPTRETKGGETGRVCNRGARESDKKGVTKD
jgi:hypothetical protein